MNGFPRLVVWWSNRDLVCTAINNDLGLIYKSQSQFEAARSCYQMAVDTRR